MKKLFITSFPLFLLVACGSSGSGDNVFYDLSSKVLPNINTTLVSGSSININDSSATNVCNDNPTGIVSTVCQTFEAYTPDNWNNEEATLGHAVSMTNFYKFIIQTDAYIADGLRSTCETINSKIQLSYDDQSDFWQSQDTYVCKAANTESSQRFKAYAWDTTNNKYAVMYDHQDDSDEALTYGFKTATAFDLAVKLYGHSSGSYRRFTGNTTETSFTMQDLDSAGTKTTIAGFAQGVGKHFLTRSGSTYYCFTINTQEDYTTSSGVKVTVITGLSYTSPATCTSSACDGCETEQVTIDGTLKSLPDAVDYLTDGMTGITVPSQHFEHAFKVL